MQELPLNQPPAGSRALTLERARDRLRDRASRDPEGLASALADLRAEFVFSTLRLTGHAAERASIAPDAEDRMVRGAFEAVGLLEREAAAGRGLSSELLCEVHRLSCPPSPGAFRVREIPAQFGTALPSRPQFIPAKVENLFEWVAAESVRSMHAVERAGLAFPRLLEISPFERGNFRTAHLLLGYFASGQGYPPFFLLFDEAEAVRDEIERAMRFDTAPLVERFAASLARSLQACTDRLSGATPPP